CEIRYCSSKRCEHCSCNSRVSYAFDVGRRRGTIAGVPRPCRHRRRVRDGLQPCHMVQQASTA
ncbi:hypothetical protein ACLOJK_040443, partial [Asimina triloba]